MNEKNAKAPKRAKKTLKILLSILACTIAFVLVVLAVGIGYFRLSVVSYYSASEKEFIIPDIHNGYLPQGLHYDERSECFFLSGYSSKGAPSSVYIVKRGEKSSFKKVFLQNEDGSPYYEHSGGISAWGDFVYITGGDNNCLYVFSYSEIMEAENEGTARCIGKFSTKHDEADYLDVSFVTVYDGKIIVGEFYREPNYPTLDTHKLTTSTGERNNALAVEFALSESEEFGIAPTPLAAYSLTDKVQGLCVDNGKIYLSTSYGAAFSVIYEHDISKLTQGNISILATDVPLYTADGNSLAKEYKIPSMSEELTMLDGRLFVLCESASNKYFFGKFLGAKWCYSTNLDEIR